jgi:hypothetical protein
MPSTTANSERRHNSRKRPPSLIYVELSSTNGGMMRDLSEDGFALRAMIPLRVGEEISFSFLLDPLTRIEGQAEVLWAEENGRVAGVRFADLPAVARTDIRSWLNDELESRESEKNAPPEAPAESFERLREELHTSPPRPESRKPKAGRSKWPVLPPEPALHAEANEENAERSPEADRFSGLPTLSASQRPDQLPLPPEPSPRRTSAQEPAARRPDVTEFPNRGAGQTPKIPALPDISQILMQQPRRPGGYAAPPRLEPLDPLHPRRDVHSGNRGEGFTLAKALAIMVLLALSVGLLVYHGTVGQSLIWLGRQIGGSQESQVLAPSSNNDASAGEVGRVPPANPPSSVSEAPATLTTPEENGAETNAAVAAPNAKPLPSIPAVESSAKPPVTPLSGSSSEAPREAGQEAGQAEYAQALQLLHDGIATDTSEAVRLLWISVEKGNPNAELTLAELYWRGQGVARNCDQTGILLGAAARKGNVDAQRRLRQFRQEGCE